MAKFEKNINDANSNMNDNSQDSINEASNDVTGQINGDINKAASPVKNLATNKLADMAVNKINSSKPTSEQPTGASELKAQGDKIDSSKATEVANEAKSQSNVSPKSMKARVTSSLVKNGGNVKNAIKGAAKEASKKFIMKAIKIIIAAVAKLVTVIVMAFWPLLLFLFLAVGFLAFFKNSFTYSGDFTFQKSDMNLTAYDANIGHAVGKVSSVTNSLATVFYEYFGESGFYYTVDDSTNMIQGNSDQSNKDKETKCSNGSVNPSVGRVSADGSLICPIQDKYKLEKNFTLNATVLLVLNHKLNDSLVTSSDGSTELTYPEQFIRPIYNACSIVSNDTLYNSVINNDKVEQSVKDRLISEKNNPTGECFKVDLADSNGQVTAFSTAFNQVYLKTNKNNTEHIQEYVKANKDDYTEMGYEVDTSSYQQGTWSWGIAPIYHYKSYTEIDRVQDIEISTVPVWDRDRQSFVSKTPSAVTEEEAQKYQAYYNRINVPSQVTKRKEDVYLIDYVTTYAGTATNDTELKEEITATDYTDFQGSAPTVTIPVEVLYTIESPTLNKTYDNIKTIKMPNGDVYENVSSVYFGKASKEEYQKCEVAINNCKTSQSANAGLGTTTPTQLPESETIDSKGNCRTSTDACLDYKIKEGILKKQTGLHFNDASGKSHYISESDLSKAKLYEIKERNGNAQLAGDYFQAHAEYISTTPTVSNYGQKYLNDYINNYVLFTPMEEESFSKKYISARCSYYSALSGTEASKEESIEYLESIKKEDSNNEGIQASVSTCGEGQILVFDGNLRDATAETVEEIPVTDVKYYDEYSLSQVTSSNGTTSYMVEVSEWTTAETKNMMGFEIQDLSMSRYNRIASILGIDVTAYKEALEAAKKGQNDDGTEEIETPNTATPSTGTNNTTGNEVVSGTDISIGSNPSTPLKIIQNSQMWSSMQKYGADYGVDPYMLAAVAAQESGGNHNSHIDSRCNNAGCGLMQIEAPGKVIKTVTAYNFTTRQNDTETVTLDKAKDLDTNIKIGAMLWGSRLAAVSYNPMVALQAYNFGTGAFNVMLKKIYMPATGITDINQVYSDITNISWIPYVAIFSQNPHNYISNWSQSTYGDKLYISHVLRYCLSSTLTFGKHDETGDSTFTIDLTTLTSTAGGGLSSGGSTNLVQATTRWAATLLSNSDNAVIKNWNYLYPYKNIKTSQINYSNPSEAYNDDIFYTLRSRGGDIYSKDKEEIITAIYAMSDQVAVYEYEQMTDEDWLQRFTVLMSPKTTFTGVNTDASIYFPTETVSTMSTGALAITRRYGYTPDESGSYGFYSSMDVKASAGTEILAVYGGKVISIDSEGTGDSGKFIKIFHGSSGNGNKSSISLYSHLESIPENLKVGDSVGTGSVIGTSGESAFTYQLTLNGQAVDSGWLVDSANYQNGYGSSVTGGGTLPGLATEFANLSLTEKQNALLTEISYWIQLQNNSGFSYSFGGMVTDYAGLNSLKNTSNWTWNNVVNYLSSGNSGRGLDCSAFVSAVLTNIGVYLNKEGRLTTVGLSTKGAIVSANPETLQAGDVLLRTGHTGIFLGKGVIAGHENEYMVIDTGTHAGGNQDLRVRPWDKSGKWTTARRMW